MSGEGTTLLEVTIPDSTITTNLDILLEHIKSTEDKSSEIENLITSKLLKYKCKEEFNKTIVEIACSEENINLETFKTLLKVVKEKMQYISQEAYFHAIENSNHAVLKEVINCFGVSLNNYEYRNFEWENGLLHLIKNKIDTNLKGDTYSEHVELLLNNNVDCENADINNRTAVWWAANKTYKKIVKLLVEKGVNLDRKTIPDPYDTARKLIQENNLLDLMDPPTAATVPTNLDIIYKIKLGEENLLLNADDITLDILIELCLQGSKHFIEHFSKYNDTQSKNNAANLNTNGVKLPKFDNEKFIEIAAAKGYYEILTFLFKQNIQITPKIVILLIQNSNKSTTAKTNYEECFNILINLKKEPLKDLLCKEDPESSNTPFYYALRSSNTNIIEKCLELEPSLMVSNKKIGFMPLDFMKARDLEALLDKCITFNRTIDTEHLNVTFKFKTLLPQKNGGIEEHKPELATVNYMCQSVKLKQLVVHPVIVMFLFMKWKNMGKLFYVNCGFRIAFMASLLGYIYVKYYAKSNSIGINVICVILWLMLFVFIVVFTGLELFMLWKRLVLPETYFFNFENYVKLMIIGLTFWIIFSGLFFVEFRKELSAFTILLFALGFVFVLGQHPKLAIYVVMFRTVMRDFSKLFLGSSIMIIAFAIAFHILFADDLINKDGKDGYITIAEGKNITISEGKHITIIIAEGKNITISEGKHISIIIAEGKNMTITEGGNIITAESKNITISEGKHITIIIAEGKNMTITEGGNIITAEGKNITISEGKHISIIIAECKNKICTEENITTAKDTNSFNSLSKSIFKTIVMATGEYDSGTINFDNNPLSSRIILCLFVFTIGIILFNLLNGLAISDIQTIKNNAEFVCLRECVQHIKFVEYLVYEKYFGKFLCLEFFKACLNHEEKLEIKYSEVLEFYSDRSKFEETFKKKLDDHFS